MLDRFIKKQNNPVFGQMLVQQRKAQALRVLRKQAPCPAPRPVLNLHKASSLGGKFDKMLEQLRAAKWNKGEEKELKPSPFNGYSSFCAALRKRGFQPLGSGYYSCVFGKPGQDKVIKVMRDVKHDGWLAYVRWAGTQGYAGTFAPKVYSYKYIKAKEGPAFGVAVMERLKGTVREGDRKKEAQVLGSLAPLVVKWQNETAGLLSDLIVPGVGKFLSELQCSFKRFDLHEGNMMVREDGSFVVTDPIAGYDCKEAEARLKAEDFTVAPRVPFVLDNQKTTGYNSLYDGLYS